MEERADASQAPLPLPPSHTAVPSDDGPAAAAAAAVVPHPSSLPLTRARSYNILGSLPTDVCLQVFRDRVVFCVSQVEGGRVGHWFLCECQPDLVRPRGLDFVTTTLLGAQRDGPDATEGVVYARQLCQELALLEPPEPSSLPSAPGPDTGPAVPTAHPTVLLGMSLHASAKGRPEVFKALIQALVLFYKESVELG